MIHLHDIRYVRLGTRDLDGASRYATEVLGLEVARKSDGAVHFRSDSRDHTLCYFEGDPRDPVLDAAAIRRAAGECLKRVPLERRIRLLGVRAGSLVRQ